jgi:phosphoserine phosphatase
LGNGLILRLFLCRHGETGHKVQGQVQGRSDSAELTAHGRDAAAALTAVIAYRRIDAVLTSPLRRATETAQIVASVLGTATGAPTVVPDLVEADLRDWQDQLRSQVRRDDHDGLQLWRNAPHLYRTRDGFSPLEQVYRQAQRFLRSLDSYDPDAALVVIGHRAINRAIINCALGIGSERHRAFETGLGSLSILERSAPSEGWTLRASNLQHHLRRSLEVRPCGASRLILVRHGETDWNRSKRYQGRIDRRLSRTGLERGRLVAEVLEGERFSQVITSPLIRAADTALAIAERSNRPLTEDDRLQEFDYGVWQGQTEEQVRVSDPGAFDDWHEAPPRATMARAEGLQRLVKRCRSFLADVGQTVTEGDGSVVVSHDVVNRVLTCEALRLPLDHFWQIRQDNCGITALDWHEEAQSWSVAVCNYVPVSLAERYDHDLL